MSRSAVETIKGYFYQFDYTIKRLLELDNYIDYIEIEHVEDVDIKTATEETAIQCKYYEKTEYNHSVIAKPIRFMLSHYMSIKSESQIQYHYKLYGYYSSGQEKLFSPITTEDLIDKFLTYTHKKQEHRHHEEVGASQEDLEGFLSVLNIDIDAQEYSEQLTSIIKSLQNQFKCSEFEAEHYYYNNSLKVIKDLSVESDIANRRINKKKFFELIDKKEILFNQWFVEYKGLRSYYRAIKSEFFTSLNTSPFDRFFLIEIDKNNYSRSELKELLLIISDKWSKLSRREIRPFCPFVYINNIDEIELIKLKKEFEHERFGFVDGYNFRGADFNSDSMLKEPNHLTGIRIKIINSIEDLKKLLRESQNTKELYQFYLRKTFYNEEPINVKVAKIQIQQLKDIKEII